MQNHSERVLVKCCVWLHIGFIGASLLAAGLILLFEGEAKWLSALTLAFSGSILAVVGWHRGRIVLDSTEQDPAVAKDAHQPRPPVSNRVAASN